MGFKSEAQRKKFQQLLKDGKINQKLFDAMSSDSEGTLPNRVGEKKEKVILKSLSELKKVSLKKRK